MILLMNYPLAFKKFLPSIQPKSLAAGAIAAGGVWAVVYFKGKNGKKFRQGEEYGSARWGNEKDIAPFIDPVFENNILRFCLVHGIIFHYALNAAIHVGMDKYTVYIREILKSIIRAPAYYNTGFSFSKLFD